MAVMNLQTVLTLTLVGPNTRRTTFQEAATAVTDRSQVESLSGHLLVQNKRSLFQLSADTGSWPSAPGRLRSEPKKPVPWETPQSCDLFCSTRFSDHTAEGDFLSDSVLLLQNKITAVWSVQSSFQLLRRKLPQTASNQLKLSSLLSP